jgi:hypothetical protein
LRKGTELLIVDIQEILVKRENNLRFKPSPNPYNPEDYVYLDKVIKRKAKQDDVRSKLKHAVLQSQDGICT